MLTGEALGSPERVDLGDYVWFWPGLAFTIGLAFLLTARTARSIGSARIFAFGLILSLGLIASATLTPSRAAVLYGVPGMGTCDLSQLDRPSLRQMFRFDETGLNVLLFVPLGVTVGFASSPRRLVALLGASLALPCVIEAVQMVATPLDRACQSSDVINNVSGVLVGFVPALLTSAAIKAGRVIAAGGLKELGERWRREP